MIGCHVVGYCVAISHCLLDDEIGVPVDYEASAPHVLAMRMPWRSASYSASLLEAWLKLIWRTYFSVVPLGEISRTPAPVLVVFSNHRRTLTMNLIGLEDLAFEPPSTRPGNLGVLVL